MNNNYNKNFAHGFKGDGMALAAGVAVPFAFAPYDLIFLSLLSPAVLIGLWLVSSPKRAFVRGYLYGIGYFGLGVSWVAVSMYRFGGMSMPLSTLATSLFVLIWAFIPALLSFIVVRYFQHARLNIKLLLVMPSLWVLFEWVRNWLFTGFPWILLGYSHVDGPLAGYGPVLGVYGISWLILFTAGLLVLIVLERGKWRYYYVAAFFTVFIVGVAVEHIQWTRPFNHPIKASLIQGNIAQDIKWHPDQRRPTIDLYTRLTREHWDSDLIIWPETALPLYYHQAENILDRLGQEARDNHSDLLIGLPVIDFSNGRQYYNAMISLGSKKDFYYKRHLVPFGEYIPLKSILGNILDFFQVPLADFSSGPAEKSYLEVAGVKAGISICYEDVFGEEVIRALPEANILVNVSNDAWFGDSFAPHQHLQKARMRAIETGRPMLRATNNGISALIDDKGRLISVSPQFKQYVLTGEVQPMTGRTPFSLYGNWLMIGFSVFLLVVGFYISRKQTLD
ncbi:MAG: apolipoprotein N-acyltransferase [Gammaproteobacteria bacterium]|nr:apolipoprotein N-acyltransferase [Gammaproteobacteria bacterium]